MTTPNGPFVPGPPVPNLPKADPKAPGAQPQPHSAEAPRTPNDIEGNFNPNVRLDTSTTSSSVHAQTRGAPADQPSHFDVGHAIGRAVGQRLSSQILAEIESWLQ